MMAPAWWRGMFICASTGTMRTPVLRTDAVQEPVIAPGNMMMRVITASSARGERPNFSMRSRAKAFRRPFLSMTFMKIMAVTSTRDTSR